MVLGRIRGGRTGRRGLPVALALALAGGSLAAEVPADSQGMLQWNRRERRVDADFTAWPLERALEKVSEATGWEVMVEPGLDIVVSARFRDRPERQALATLLADVNFALLPGKTGGTRLLVFRSSTADATVAIRPVKAPAKPAADLRLGRELVVRLKPGSGTDIHALAARLGAKVIGSIDALGAYRLEFADEAAASAARTALAEEEGVASVESNYAIPAPGERPLPLGGTVAAGSLRARPVKDGSSVVIALLDTGVTAEAVVHADFLLPTVQVTGTPGTAGGQPSHGSAMFETIIQGLSTTDAGQGAQPVRVLPVDIYGNQAQTSTFELSQGIVAALDRGADILNLSLSGPSPSPLVQDVLRQAAGAGVLAFGAPGNEPTTAPTYPAAYPEVVAVTASDRSGQVASYANRGSFVDLMAPGTSVVPYAGENWVVNGTSVSTAYAAGLAGGLMAEGGRSANDVLSRLTTRLGFSSGAPAAGPGTP